MLASMENPQPFSELKTKITVVFSLSIDCIYTIKEALNRVKIFMVYLGKTYRHNFCGSNANGSSCNNNRLGL